MKDILKSFLISFFIASGLFLTVGNVNQTKASLDRCEALIQEIEDQAEYLNILNTYYNF